MEDGRKLTCRYDAEGLRHETEENGRLVRFIYSGKDAVCEEEDDNITDISGAMEGSWHQTVRMRGHTTIMPATVWET